MKKKILSLFMVIAITMFTFAPTMVNAGQIGQTGQDNVVETKEELEKESSVYFGEIFIDGVSKMQYVYSADITRSETVFSEIKDATIEPFKTLVPTLSGAETNVGVKEYNYDIEPETSINASADWTSASSVANALYPTLGTIGNETNKNMYDHSTSVATAIENQKTERAGYFDTLISSSKEVVSRLRVLTDYVWKNNEGTLYKEYTVTFKVEKTTLYYTSVNITTETTPATPTKINTLNIDITSPKVGDTATETTKPSVTIDSNPNYEIDHIAYITAYPSEKPAGEYDVPFTGTFEADKDYVVEVSLKAKDGYVFADNDNMTLKVNGKTTEFEKNEWNADGSTYYMFFAKVQATAEEEPKPTPETTTYEYIDNTANQKYTINENDTLTFRINADYSLFENGGKVYVDDTLVNSDNYTSKSGSTIITFTKDYMSSLSEGEHTLKVAFNNGGNATTKFTVAKANTTTPTTTTNNPQTGDNILFYISMLGLSIIGLAGAGIYTKKKLFSKQ